jgi:hypothetical protein
MVWTGSKNMRLAHSEIALASEGHIFSFGLPKFPCLITRSEPVAAVVPARGEVPLSVFQGSSQSRREVARDRFEVVSTRIPSIRQTISRPRVGNRLNFSANI